MPIYEFYSPKTHTIYSFFARSLAHAGKVPRCPDDPTAPMERVASGFAIPKGRPDPAAVAGESLDPRMESALEEMEREFGSMNEANPDPRQMAAMMRKMAELSGQKMPDVFNEMIDRMAAGEDPDALEAEYGDALGDLDENLGEESEEVGATTGVRALLRRNRRPARDKTLYEITDYLP